jgi:hypothetical protein
VSTIALRLFEKSSLVPNKGKEKEKRKKRHKGGIRFVF